LREGFNAANQCVSTNTWAYDANGGDSPYTVYAGQTYKVTDDEGWQKFSYDVRNRTVKSVRYLSKNGNTYTNQFTFDDADRNTSTFYPNSGPTITNIFDAGEHLSQVKQVGGTNFYTAKGFNALEQLNGINFGNGVGTTLSYYSVSRRLNQIVTSKSTNLQSLAYNYDANGNVTNVTDGVYSGSASGTISKIQYDDLNRLTSLTNASGTFSYAYSSIGNVLTNKESGSSNYVYGTIRPHAVRSANGMWFTYDLNGNVVFRSKQRLDYDVNNRLYRVINTNGTVTTFGYDASGARLWELNGTNSLQVWIGNNYEEKNGQILYHVYAGGRQVATVDKTGTNVFQYYHPDDLTSTSIQTDTNGAVVQNYEYSAFGQSRYTQSTNVFKASRRYTGQVLDDATGLYYYNARYYDPQLGRFTQPDDIIPDFSNPQSYNRYSYCVNNPLRYTDPSGHWGQEVADWWSGTVDAGANYISASPSHWVWNGTVGTLDSLVGGVGEPLRLGSTAGALSGSGNATAGQIAIGTVQEVSRAAAVIPVGAAIGKGVGTLLGAGEKEAAGQIASQAGPHFSGTEKPWTKGATPNSTYTHIDPKTGKAVQNATYDSEGKVISHVDFKNHGPNAPSGHGHTFPEPGNPASGHGPGNPHIPNSQLPAGADKLPPGIEPHTPIGQ
jgi:RHS repeat-associated protein